MSLFYIYVLMNTILDSVKHKSFEKSDKVLDTFQFIVYKERVKYAKKKVFFTICLF